MDLATVVSLDLRTLFCWLIVGRPKSGKQNLLQILAAVAQKKGGRVIVVDFEQKWNSQARRTFRYLHTDRGLYEFLVELQEELMQKKQQKKDLTQTFFIILNLSEWISHIRRPEAGVPDMAGFLENITEKGEGIGLYFFAAMIPEEMGRYAGDMLYRNLTRGRSGICLGGDVIAQTLLDFSGLSYQEQKRKRKPGIALLPAADGEGRVQRVKIPLVE